MRYAIKTMMVALGVILASKCGALTVNWAAVDWSSAKRVSPNEFVTLQAGETWAVRVMLPTDRLGKGVLGVRLETGEEETIGVFQVDKIKNDKVSLKVGKSKESLENATGSFLPKAFNPCLEWRIEGDMLSVFAVSGGNTVSLGDWTLALGLETVIAAQLFIGEEGWSPEIYFYAPSKSSVPEPTVVSLLMIGFAGLAFRRRRFQGLVRRKRFTFSHPLQN